MKSFIQVLAAGLLCCAGSVAHAAAVTYTYQAKVNFISERMDPNANFASVEQSDFAGATVTRGDFITGSFRYDTAVGLGSYQPDQQPGSVYRLYRSADADYISYVDKNSGLSLTTPSSMNWLGSNQVHDSVPVPGGYAADFFSMTRYADGETMFKSAGIFIDDVFGNAFQSADMPEYLDLAAFQFATLDASFLRLSDRAYMSFSADITSLQRVDADVPEPASALLFAIAGGGLFSLRRMRRS